MSKFKIGDVVKYYTNVTGYCFAKIIEIYKFTNEYTIYIEILKAADNHFYFLAGNRLFVNSENIYKLTNEDKLELL